MDKHEKAEVDRLLRAEAQKIGERLQEARKIAGLTGDQAGELIGAGKAHIGHLESGRSQVKAAQLARLAAEYKQSCDWLILGRRLEGLSPDAARLAAIFSELPEDERKTVLEFAEDRLRRRRAAAPRKSHAA